jgi:hypothetical protein
MLVALLEWYLPGGWRLVTELLLTRLPQRVDIVVVRRDDQPLAPARKIHSIFDYLRTHTLIEHKGPTDDLQPGDALTLLGYAAQYMRMNKLSDPVELCLMVVADHVPPGFVKQVERMGGKLERTGGGLLRGEMAGLTLHGVETADACRAGATERLLYAFSRAFRVDPHGGPPLDVDELGVYHILYQQVEQFRRNRGSMAVRDMDELKRASDELLRELFAKMPPEDLTKGLGALTPEHIAAAIDALPPEAREQIKQRLH